MFAGKIGNPHKAEGIKLDKVFTPDKPGTGIIACTGICGSTTTVTQTTVTNSFMPCLCENQIFPDSAKTVQIC